MQTGRRLLAKNNIAPESLDEVVIGCVMPSENEANIGRLVALRLGCGDDVPGWTVQRNCSSGMQAIDSAYKDIITGRANLVLAGGAEAMSRAPLLFNKAMTMWFVQLNKAKSLSQKLLTMLQFKLKFLKPIIALLQGLTDPMYGVNMGHTAEQVAYEFNIDRKQMDQFAEQSQIRASFAQENNLFPEITDVFGTNGKVYELDTGVRADSTLTKLGQLKPIFDRKFGSVTAGNSSQVTDGSALMLLASEEGLKEHNLTSRARIIDFEWAALDPQVMGLGPVFATVPLLIRNGLTVEDIGYWEINEAFAGQVLGCLAAFNNAEFCKKHFNLDEPFGQISQDKLNIHGGAIALGHPVGASGARIIQEVVKVLERMDKQYGVASICIGGGQGGAILIERV